MKEIYKKSESYLLNFAPFPVKYSLRKEGIKKLFKEWLKLENLTLKELLSFNPHEISFFLYYSIRFPSRKIRDKQMIKMINKYAKKGKTAVVVGASHIEIWIKNNWIKKI